MSRTGLITSAGVLLVFLISFGSVLYSLIAAIPLLVALLLTSVWTKGALGGFNLAHDVRPVAHPRNGRRLRHPPHLPLHRGAKPRRDVLEVGLHHAVAQGPGYSPRRDDDRPRLPRPAHRAVARLVRVGSDRQRRRPLRHRVRPRAHSDPADPVSVPAPQASPPREGRDAVAALRRVLPSPDAPRRRHRRPRRPCRHHGQPPLYLATGVRFQFSSNDLVPRSESQANLDKILTSFDLGGNAQLGTSFLFFAKTEAEMVDLGTPLDAEPPRPQRELAVALPARPISRNSRRPFAK